MTRKSDKHKLKDEYNYIKGRARARGFDKSPYFPKNDLEFAAHRAAVREAEASRLKFKITNATELKKTRAANKLEAQQRAEANRLKCEILVSRSTSMNQTNTSIQNHMVALQIGTSCDEPYANEMVKTYKMEEGAQEESRTQDEESPQDLNTFSATENTTFSPGEAKNLGVGDKWGLRNREPLERGEIPYPVNGGGWCGLKTVPLFSSTLPEFKAELHRRVPDHRIVAENIASEPHLEETKYNAATTSAELAVADVADKHRGKNNHPGNYAINANAKYKWTAPPLWTEDDTALDVAIRQFIQTTLHPDTAVPIPVNQNVLYDPTADLNDRYKLGWGKKAAQAARFFKGSSWETQDLDFKQQEPEKTAAGQASVDLTLSKKTMPGEDNTNDSGSDKGGSGTGEMNAASQQAASQTDVPTDAGDVTASKGTTIETLDTYDTNEKEDEMSKPHPVTFSASIAHQHQVHAFLEDNPFSQTHPITVAAEEVAWPTLQELAHEGDMRAGLDGSLDRFLPLPRRNVACRRLVKASEIRDVVGGQSDPHANFTSRERSYSDPVFEIRACETPVEIADLLKEMDEE